MQAAADAEDRLARIVKDEIEDREFRFIAFLTDAANGSVIGFSIAGWIDITASGNEDPVKPEDKFFKATSASSLDFP